jgi:hypothetical protein
MMLQAGLASFNLQVAFKFIAQSDVCLAHDLYLISYGGKHGILFLILDVFSIGYHASRFLFFVGISCS